MEPAKCDHILIIKSTILLPLPLSWALFNWVSKNQTKVIANQNNWKIISGQSELKVKPRKLFKGKKAPYLS